MSNGYTTLGMAIPHWEIHLNFQSQVSLPIKWGKHYLPLGFSASTKRIHVKPLGRDLSSLKCQHVTKILWRHSKEGRVRQSYIREHFTFTFQPKRSGTSIIVRTRRATCILEKWLIPLSPCLLADLKSRLSQGVADDFRGLRKPFSYMWLRTSGQEQVAKPWRTSGLGLSREHRT